MNFDDAIKARILRVRKKAINPFLIQVLPVGGMHTRKLRKAVSIYNIRQALMQFDCVGVELH